jgi:hypothetical protein
MPPTRKESPLVLFAKDHLKIFRGPELGFKGLSFFNANRNNTQDRCPSRDKKKNADKIIDLSCRLRPTKADNFDWISAGAGTRWLVINQETLMCYSPIAKIIDYIRQNMSGMAQELVRLKQNLDTTLSSEKTRGSPEMCKVCSEYIITINSYALLLKDVCIMLEKVENKDFCNAEAENKNYHQ